MAIDIQKLFADIIPDTAKQDAEQGANLASAYKGTSPLGSIGATDALLAPARNRRMRGAASAIAQPLFGVSFDTPAEKLQKTLQGVDVSTPEGEDAAFRAISAIDGNKAIQFRIAMQEQKRAQQTADAQTATAAASTRNATTAEAELPIQITRNNILQQQADTETEQLILAKGTQEDLVTWRTMQDAVENRRLTMQEESNRINDELAILAANDLDSRSAAAVREATKEGREHQTAARNALMVANEFVGVEALSGSRAIIAEKWKAISGNQDEVTRIKTMFNGVKNALAMDALPPGAASDIDVALALTGFPDDTWPPERIASYMKGIAKISALAAAEAEARGLHMLANKGIDAKFAGEWRAKMAEEGFVENILATQGLELSSPDASTNDGLPSQEDMEWAAEQLRQQDAEARRKKLADSTRGWTL